MRKPRQKSWWIPWVFVGAFVVIIAVNGVMVSFALNSWTGLETRNHFRAGNNYNAALAGAGRQAELGWQNELRFIPTTSDGASGRLEVVFTEKHGAAITDAEMKVRLIRAAKDSLDQELTLFHQGNGLYVSAVDFPAKGRWQVRLLARRAREPYQMLDELYVR